MEALLPANPMPPRRADLGCDPLLRFPRPQPGGAELRRELRVACNIQGDTTMSRDTSRVKGCHYRLTIKPTTLRHVTGRDKWGAARMKALRQQKLLTQEELARRTGVARETIVKLENGARALTPHYIVKIAPALGVKPSELAPPDLPSEHPSDPLVRLEAVEAAQKKLAVQVVHLARLVGILDKRGQTERQQRGHS